MTSYIYYVSVFLLLFLYTSRLWVGGILAYIAFTYRELIYNVIWSRFLHVFVLSWRFIRPGFRGFLSKVSGRALYKYLVPLKMSQFPSLYVRIYIIYKSSIDRRRKNFLWSSLKMNGGWRRQKPISLRVLQRHGEFSLCVLCSGVSIVRRLKAKTLPPKFITAVCLHFRVIYILE